jgi:tetratricopeptide (TPR) repeat protein
MTNDISTALRTLRLDPDDGNALQALLSLPSTEADPKACEELDKAIAAERVFHAEANNLTVCLRLIDAEIALATEPTIRAALLVEKARFLWSELWQVDDTREALKRAAELVPGFAAADAMIREIEQEVSGWEEQAKSISAQAADAGDRPAASPLLAAEAELLLRHRNSVDEAEALFKRSLKLDPRNRRAALALERLLRRKGREKDLAEFLAERIAAADSPTERGAAELSAGVLADKMGNRADAIEHCRQSLLAAPSDERAYRVLDRLVPDRNDLGDLIKIYEAALKAAKRGQSEVPAALALGELYWKRLGKLDEAEQSFRRVKKVQPFDSKVVAFYREYYLSRDEIPHLLALLGQAQKNETDPEIRIQYGIEMATVAERRPQLLEKAIDAWKLLLRIKPGLPEAVQALRRLYTKAEKWNALLELLKDQCEALPAGEIDEKVRCYLEMVPIYRDRLKLEVMVINTYAAILTLRPDHEEALIALAERYEVQGRWGDLAGVLTRQAQAVADVSHKVALYHRIAKLWLEKFGNHHNAIGALERILEVEPRDVQARATLRDIYTRGRSWRALLDLLRRELPLLDADARRTHLAEMAVLAAERLADLRQAIGLWNEVLEIAPADRAAVTTLAGLYEREKRWPALAEILGRLAESAGGENSPDGCALLERRGLILLEKLGAGQAALETLRRVSTAQPENPRVLRALREAYSQTGDIDALESLYSMRHAWDDLCDVLSGLAERTADMRLRTRAFERIADIAKNRLNQTERVIKAYEGILATDPQNRAVARAAAELYEKAERWGRLVATYEILLGPESAPAMPPEESLGILERARQVCESKLQAKALAFKWCARAYRIAPTDVKVRSDLERLAGEAEEWSMLLALFIERQGMVGAYGPSPEERVDLLRRCLHILVTHVDQPVDLQRFAETILAEVPGDPEAELALIKLFTEKERWPELVALQQTRQKRMSDPTLRAECLLRIARIQEEKLGDAKIATRSLQEAVEVEPENLRALRELARLLEEQSDFRSLVAVLGRQASLSEDTDRALALLRLGKIYEKELGQHKDATDSYLQALDIDNIAAGAVEGLERMLAAGAIRAEDIGPVATRLAPYYELTENYPKWAQTLESLVTVATSPTERKANLEMLADLYAGPLGDTVAAYGAVARIFELDPSNHTVRDRLVQLAELVGKLSEIAESARRVLANTEQRTLRLELLMLIADVEERQPQRLSDAEAALRQVLEIDPLHGGAYKTLCRICKDAERWAALRDLIGLREQNIPDLKQRIELLWQVIEIDEGLLYDRAHATTTLRRIIELDPNDLKAYRILERHYTDAEKWRELDNLLQTETSLVQRGDIADLKARRAELALVRFGEAESALHFVAEALDLSANHPQAIPLLEQALKVAAVRHRAAEMLDELYTASYSWLRLVEILDVEREVAEGAAASALLMRKAELQEGKLESPAQAFDTWRAVLDLDPQATRALAEAERLGEKLGRHADLIAMYQRLADKRDPSDVAGIADLLSRAARLCKAHLPDRQAAIVAWRRVLDLDPTNAQTGGPAAEALETLYSEAGDIAGLVHVLRTKADWPGSVSEHGQLLLRVAELQETRLNDVEHAIETYRGLLDGDVESSSRAFDNLDRIFQKTNQARERVELLKRRLEHSEANARRALRFLIATILETELADLDEAVATIRPILDDLPEDREALTTLARLYQIQGVAVDHLEILERLYQLAGSDSERIDLLRQIAGLLQGPLGRQAEALDKWREILRLAPKDPAAMAEMERLLTSEDVSLRFAAAETLEPIYAKAGDYPHLAGILRIFIALAEDGHTRANYRVRLAGIEENQLGDKKAAFQTWSDTIKDATGDPELDRLLDSYERLAAALGQDTILDIIDLYRAVEPDILAETTRMRVQQTVAQYAIKLGDLPLATEYYNRIVERRPDDDSALAALESIFEERQENEQLYDVILRRADLAQNPKAELALRRRGALLAAKLERHEDAIAAWERVWSMNSNNAEAVDALDALYTQLGRWDDLSNLLERRLEYGVSAGVAIDLRFRLAEIQRVQLANRNRALEYLSTVLAGQPDHAQAIQILQDMLSDPEVCVEAANLLEPVYIRRNAWKDLVAIDSLRLKFSEDPSLRLAWTQRIAQVYEEQIEDLDEAFNWYGRVFQERPTDVAAQEQLLRLAPKQNRWRDLGRLLDEYLDNESANSDEVLALVRMAIRVYDQELDDRDSARRHYRRYVEAQPGDRAASQLFEDALERWEAWAELRDLIDEQIRLVDSARERVALLHRSAALSDIKLLEASPAIESLRAILEIDPDDRMAAVDLDRLLTREERWEDLREHLLWMLARTEDAHAKDTLTLELAHVEAEHLANASTAVDHYGEVLTRSPANSDAIAALEALLGESELRARVAELLEPAFRTVRDVAKLASTLEVRLETLDDPGRRVAAFREIANICIHLGRGEDALVARGKAWLEDVTNAETLVELESLAASQNEFEKLVGILSQGVELTMDPDLRGDLCAFKANILDARLNSPERAIEAWREALAARPDHQDAFVALERLLGDAGRTVELCETLEKHAEVVVEAEQREALTKRVAALYESPLGDLGRAIGAWRSVLDMDQENEEALDALSRLYAATSDWQNLVETVGHKIDGASDPQLVRALRFQAAELYDEKLGQLSDAAEQLRRILERSPSDVDALDMLASIHLREKQYGELVEVLDRRTLITTVPTERDALAYQAAKITEHEILDLPDAIARYRKILDTTPSHAESRAALWVLARGEDNRLLAVDALEPLLRLGQEWKPLCELLELRLLAVDVPAERLEILADIAQVQEAALADLAASFDTWARALAEDAASEDAKASLERLAEINRSYDKLAEVYEERLKSSYDSEQQRWYGSRLAEIYERILGKPERAVELWRDVEMLPGSESLALARQESLLRMLDRSQDLADVLAREAEIATDPTVQAAYWAALGELRLGPLADRDGAIAAFRSSLDCEPRQDRALAALRNLALGQDPPVDALDILQPLAEERGDFGELVGLLSSRLKIVDDDADRASLLRKIADVYESRLRDLPHALEMLGRALSAEPTSTETVDRLEHVADLAGMPGEAAKCVEAVLDAVDPMLFSEMALRAATLHLRTSGAENEDAALKLYLRVLDADPENVTALEALDSLYRQRGDGKHLAEVIEKRGALELDPSRRLALYGEAAHLHESSGDLQAAIAAWRTGREGDETNLDAIDELARLYRTAGEHDEQVEILREKARVLDDGQQRCAVLMEVAFIKSGSLSDLDGAVEAVRDALDADPHSAVAMATLVELEEKRQDWAAVEEALLRQEAAATGDDRVAALGRLASNAAERMNDPDRALSYLQQILVAEPTHQAAFTETERLLTSLERWHELIEMLERKADVEARQGNRASELALRVKVAAIWGEKLGAEDSALEALEAVLAREPGHFSSLMAVARIHESRQEWEQASAALERAAGAATTPQDKADVLCRRATILAANEGSADDLTALYQEALANDSKWLPAITALEDIARKTGNHAQLVVQLTARLDLEKDEAKQKTLLSEIATLYLGPLGKAHLAVPPLERLAKLLPNDSAVHENLGRALIASGRVEEGEAALTSLIELLGKGRRQKDVARLQAVLGSFAEARDDLDMAKQRYAAAYQIDPTQASVLGALSRLALRQRDVESARRYLRTLLLQSFDEKAAGITKAQVYLELGNLHLQAGENAKARNMYERGLEAEPKNEQLKKALAATPK